MRKIFQRQILTERNEYAKNNISQIRPITTNIKKTK